jgi:hypothetical protein
VLPFDAAVGILKLSTYWYVHVRRVCTAYLHVWLFIMHFMYKMKGTDI